MIVHLDIVVEVSSEVSYSNSKIDVERVCYRERVSVFYSGSIRQRRRHTTEVTKLKVV